MENTLEDKIMINMFGCFDITINGKTIFLETSGNVKAIALFRFLLAHKGKVFTAESIAENVWPENEYINEKKVMRTYIHRLRKIISQENAFKRDFSEEISLINIKGGYKIETSNEVIIDMDLFEKYKKIAITSIDDNELIAVFHKTMEIFSREFLEECRNDNWVIIMRNNYLKAFASFVITILSKFIEKKNYYEVVDICETCFSITPLDEPINLIYLQALYELGQFEKANQHHAFFTTKLHSELSISPSDKFKKIFLSIKKAMQKDLDINIETNDGNLMDKSEVADMINSAVKSFLSADKQRYAIAYVFVYKINNGDDNDRSEYEFMSDEEKEEVKENLVHAFEYALRKNDMYSITEDGLSIVVLHDAKVEFYENIINRINNAFYSKFDELKYRIKIKVSSVNFIM